MWSHEAAYGRYRVPQFVHVIPELLRMSDKRCYLTTDNSSMLIRPRWLAKLSFGSRMLDWIAPRN